MNSYALVVDGVVRSVEDHLAPPVTHPSLIWVECTGNAAAVPGATVADGVFTASTVDPAQLSAERASAARAARDFWLAACDWTQMPDAPLSDAVRAAWRTYRQALRDITATSGFPDAITWPQPPGSRA